MRRLFCICCCLFTAANIFAAVRTAGADGVSGESSPVVLPRDSRDGDASSECDGSAASRRKVLPLRVEGTTLTVDGTPVVLRGVSYGWHNLWPRFYNDGSVRFLADTWQVDVVRAAMGIELPDGWLERPRKSERLVRRVVEAAIEEGIYVIVDWHCHDLLPREASAFFARMARRYRGVPNMIYEICNEPDDRFTWPEVKEYAVEVIRAIRREDPEAMILVGSPHWDQDVHLAADDPIEGVSNVMYTLHFYAGTHRDELRERADYALDKGLPLFVSECGASEASGDGRLDADSWLAWQEWMRSRSLSWLAWSVGDKRETSALLLPEAPSRGAWGDTVLTPWGKLLTNEFNR